MTSLILKNFRCFTDPGPIPLGKLTFLVGENSTGKSTILAAVRLAWSLAYGQTGPNFNEEPFFLGNYKDIAHRAGHRRRADHFEIGFVGDPATRKGNGKGTVTEPVPFRARFHEVKSQPELAGWNLDSPPYGIRWEARQGIPGVLTVNGPFGVWHPGRAAIFGEPNRVIQNLEMVLLASLNFDVPASLSARTAKNGSGARPDDDSMRAIVGSVRAAFPDFGTDEAPKALGPVRMSPKRTYDQVHDPWSPDGRHVPLFLAKLSEEGRERWELVAKPLADFGKESGLFDRIEVKHLTRQEGGPFQLQVKFRSSAFNLVDVGYGVSQGLPIAVESIISRPGSTMLLQQPEVHLHPRAQAAFGSLLVSLAAEHKKRFVVETHSDYILDRVRMDLRRDKKLSPEDVKILYFERVTPTEVKIHSIELDWAGNIVNAPLGYRRFFLTETDRFLGM